MTINFKKLTVGVHQSFAAFTQEHIFKSADDAGDFARHILDELANRRVNLKMTVSGHDVEIREIPPPEPKRYGFFISGERVMSNMEFETVELAIRHLEENHPEWVWHRRMEFENSTSTSLLKIREIPPPVSKTDPKMFSCECGWPGPKHGKPSHDADEPEPGIELPSWWRKHYKWKFSIVDGTPSFSNPLPRPKRYSRKVKIRVEKPARPSHEMIGNLKPGDVVDIETGGEKWRVEITGGSGTRDNYWSRPFYSFKSSFCDGGVIEFTQNDIVKIVSMPIQKPVTFEEFFDHFVKKHEDIIDDMPRSRLAGIWQLEMEHRERNGLKAFCNPYLDTGIEAIKKGYRII